SYSTQRDDPLSGPTRRRSLVFQVPNSKSKSRWPSRATGACATVAAVADGGAVTQPLSASTAAPPSIRCSTARWIRRDPTSRSPVRDVVRTKRHRHVLRLEEHLVAPCATLAADATGLGAAERLPQVADVLAVDEAHPGFDRG